MSNLTFLTNNRLLEGEVSMITGTENAQFPLKNIKHAFTTKVFRSNEGYVELLIDLKATDDINAFAIVGSSVNGLGFGDVKLQGSLSTDFTGSPVIPVDVSANHNFGFALFEPEGAFRFWKLTFTNTGGDYVEVSNLYLGDKTEIVTNGITTESFKYSNEDNLNISANKYGQKFIDKFNNIKTLEGEVKFVNAEEFDLLNDMYIQTGQHLPVWALVDPEGQMGEDSEFMFSGYFYFGKDLKWQLAAPFLYNVKINLIEAT